MTLAEPQPGGSVRCERPWGWFENLAAGEGYLIKRLRIAPGRRISLQRHHHRSEQWLIISGAGQVVIDGMERPVRSGDSLFLQLGTIHRAAAGDEGLEILEVQRGDLLSEDDIERFADDYGRVVPPSAAALGEVGEPG